MREASGSFTVLILIFRANDNAYSINSTAFEQVGNLSTGSLLIADYLPKTYLSFITHLRELYPTQPLFILNPWGWPAADGSISYYYAGVYQDVVAKR